MDIRVATANLHGLRAAVERVAGMLEPEDFDVAMLQETGPRNSFRELAERLNMDHVMDPLSMVRRRIHNGLLLGRSWRVAEVEHHRFSGSHPWYPRGATTALLVRGGARFWSVSTHLGLNGAERRRHAEELHQIMWGRRPFVLGGDLNAEESSRTVAILGNGAIDVGKEAGPTFPAARPTARIDYLFVSPEIGIRSVGVAGDDAASDHRMVIAGLILPTG